MGRKPSAKTTVVEQAMEAQALLELAQRAIEIARQAVRAVAGQMDGSRQQGGRE